MSTYSLLTPLFRVPDDVVAFLVQPTELTRLHDIILREPYLELLMPPPVAVVAANRISVGRLSKTG